MTVVTSGPAVSQEFAPVPALANLYANGATIVDAPDAYMEKALGKAAGGHLSGNNLTRAVENEFATMLDHPRRRDDAFWRLADAAVDAQTEFARTAGQVYYTYVPGNSKRGMVGGVLFVGSDGEKLQMGFQATPQASGLKARNKALATFHATLTGQPPAAARRPDNATHRRWRQGNSPLGQAVEWNASNEEKQKLVQAIRHAAQNRIPVRPRTVTHATLPYPALVLRHDASRSGGYRLRSSDTAAMALLDRNDDGRHDLFDAMWDISRCVAKLGRIGLGTRSSKAARTLADDEDKEQAMLATVLDKDGYLHFNIDLLNADELDQRITDQLGLPATDPEGDPKLKRYRALGAAIVMAHRRKNSLNEPLSRLLADKLGPVPYQIPVPDVTIAEPSKPKFWTAPLEAFPKAFPKTAKRHSDYNRDKPRYDAEVGRRLAALQQNIWYALEHKEMPASGGRWLAELLKWSERGTPGLSTKDILEIIDNPLGLQRKLADVKAADRAAGKAARKQAQQAAMRKTNGGVQLAGRGVSAAGRTVKRVAQRGEAARVRNQQKAQAQRAASRQARDERRLRRSTKPTPRPRT